MKVAERILFLTSSVCLSEKISKVCFGLTLSFVGTASPYQFCSWNPLEPPKPRKQLHLHPQPLSTLRSCASCVGLCTSAAAATAPWWRAPWRSGGRRRRSSCGRNCCGRVWKTWRKGRASRATTSTVRSFLS